MVTSPTGYRMSLWCVNSGWLCNRTREDSHTDKRGLPPHEILSTSRPGARPEGAGGRLRPRVLHGPCRTHRGGMKEGWRDQPKVVLADAKAMPGFLAFSASPDAWSGATKRWQSASRRP